MFVRTATRRNKDGSAVRYVQLVHNEWDPVTKSSRMRVVHSFGREDQLDRAAIERLAGSLGRLLGPGRDAAPAVVPGLAYDDACYRAMDWLHQVRGPLEKQVFSQVATVLDLEVDLLFFDTTSTYFEVEDQDEPVLRDQDGSPAPAGAPAGDGGQAAGSSGDEGTAGGNGQEMAGFRVFGKSKDHRDDLPQIVIGMAVTRGGIPVRVWCWPGDT